MIPADELWLDYFWDVEEVLVMQHIVDIISALLAELLISLELLGLLVFRLQFV